MTKSNGNTPPAFGYEEWKKENYPKPKTNIIFKAEASYMCPKCKKIYPRTGIYFYNEKTSKDGLTSQCKECMYNKEKKVEKTKICSSCKKKIPVTFEYFYRNAKSPDGYAYACRTCANKRRKENNQKKKMGEMKVSDKFKEFKEKEKYTLEEIRNIGKNFNLTDEQIAKYIRGEDKK